MDNYVTFRLQFESNGETELKTLSVNADDFRDAVKTATEEVKHFDEAVVNWAQAGQAVEQLQDCLGSLYGVMEELSSAWEAQSTAETKLANNMRNTMAATEEDIEAIKRLTAAQQELGVVGDEVQLAGAQELATYLEERESLEELIPVMNDMIAQQYGLGASQESAAQIASMLGKVMAGQTAALSRYGYTFTEAQEEILKFGTESARAAVLAEVVESSVGGMNAALAQTSAGRMQQLTNTLGDVKEMAGQVVSRLMPFITTLKTVTDTATGAMKTWASLKSVWAAFGPLITRLTTRLGVLRTAQAGATVSTTALRVAVVGLTSAVTLGLTVAIAALTEWLGRSSGAAEEAKEKSEALVSAENAFTSAFASAKTAIETARGELSELIDAKKDTSAAVQELAGKFPGLVTAQMSGVEAYQALTNGSKNYCTQLALEAKTRELTRQMGENEAKRLIAEQKKRELEESGKARAAIGAYDTPQGIQFTYGDTQAYSDVKKEIESIEAANAELEKQLRLAETAAGTLAQEMTQGADNSRQSYNELGKQIEANRKRLADWKGTDAEADALKAETAELEKQQRLLGIRLGLIKESTKTVKPPKRPETENIQLGTQVSFEGLDKKLQAAVKGVDVTISPKIETQSWSEQLSAARKQTEDLSMSIGAVSQTMNDLGNAIGGQAGEWMKWGGNVLSAIGSAIPAITALINANMANAAAGAASSQASIPFVGPVLAVAAVASVLAAIMGIPKFANGAIAYGPTLGLFGEYAGAASNPEVVAPLNRLKELIGTDEGGGKRTVEFRLRGRDLVAVADRELLLQSRS